MVVLNDTLNFDRVVAWDVLFGMEAGGFERLEDGARRVGERASATGRTTAGTSASAWDQSPISTESVSCE